MNSVTAQALTTALLNAGIDYRVFQPTPGNGDWRVQANQPGGANVQDVINLANNHGVAAFTDRAEFR